MTLELRTVRAWRTLMKNSLLAFSLFVFSVCSICVFSSSAYAESSASDIVSNTVDKVKQTVVSRTGQVSPEELDKELRDIITPVFDFREMSRRSLAKYWKNATPQQQQEFVDLFSSLLATNYLKKIRENAASSSLNIVGEQDAGKNRKVVKTTVDVKGSSASIDYRMRAKDNTWKVYDVIIENIGLVSNYRSEFSGIVQKDGVDGLISKLKKKNE
jgi:phospholipid transport system substrate-binding protein